MTGEGDEQEKNKPKREQARVSESRKLTERRKSSSDRLFVLERDLNLDGSLTEPKICALELLSAKVKRQISSRNYLYLQSKVIARIFPPIKVRKSPPLDHHRAVEREKYKAARI